MSYLSYFFDVMLACSKTYTYEPEPEPDSLLDDDKKRKDVEDHKKRELVLESMHVEFLSHSGLNYKASDVLEKIFYKVDCERIKLQEFVMPLYELRQDLSERMGFYDQRLLETSRKYLEAKRALKPALRRGYDRDIDYANYKWACLKMSCNVFIDRSEDNQMVSEYIEKYQRAKNVRFNEAICELRKVGKNTDADKLVREQVAFNAHMFLELAEACWADPDKIDTIDDVMLKYEEHCEKHVVAENDFPDPTFGPEYPTKLTLPWRLARLKGVEEHRNQSFSDAAQTFLSLLEDLQQRGVSYVTNAWALGIWHYSWNSLYKCYACNLDAQGKRAGAGRAEADALIDFVQRAMCDVRNEAQEKDPYFHSTRTAYNAWFIETTIYLLDICWLTNGGKTVSEERLNYDEKKIDKKDVAIGAKLLPLVKEVLPLVHMYAKNEIIDVGEDAVPAPRELKTTFSLCARFHDGCHVLYSRTGKKEEADNIMTSEFMSLVTPLTKKYEADTVISLLRHTAILRCTTEVWT